MTVDGPVGSDASGDGDSWWPSLDVFREWVGVDSEAFVDDNASIIEAGDLRLITSFKDINIATAVVGQLKLLLMLLVTLIVTPMTTVWDVVERSSAAIRTFVTDLIDTVFAGGFIAALEVGFSEIEVWLSYGGPERFVIAVALAVFAGWVYATVVRVVS